MLVLAGSAAVCLAQPNSSSAQTGGIENDAGGTIRRTVQYSVEMRNSTSRVIEEAGIGILIPVAESSAQRCCERLKASYPSETLNDDSGNQALRFVFANLPPNAIKEIQVRAVLNLSDAPEPTPEPGGSSWLASEPLIQVDNPKIQERAKALAGKDALQTAHRIYDWIAGTLAYAGYLRDARGALYALEKQRGDCTEYMHLFVALARANDIPARGMAGYLVEQDAILSADEFHNWAEFYADGAWRIADAQRGEFDSGYGRYIAIRILATDSADIPPNATRFWVSGEGLRVRMR